MPDLAARTGGSSSSRFLLSDRWGVLAGFAYGLHRKTLPHSLILRGKDEDEDQQFEEEKRLLYVAVTRARRMLVLGEGFSGRAAGLWHRWAGALFEDVQPGALEKAREGKTSRIRFRGRGQDFSVEMLSASAFTRPEQLPLNIDMAGVHRDAVYREFQELSHALESEPGLQPSGLELTPSELSELQGCFRHFHWTRLLGLHEPGTRLSDGAHSCGWGPSRMRFWRQELYLRWMNLRLQGVPDLHAVFASKEWQSLEASEVERELPFIMHLRAANGIATFGDEWTPLFPGRRLVLLITNMHSGERASN